MEIENLPLVVLQKIFKFLPERILEDVIPKVNSEWNQISVVFISSTVEGIDYKNKYIERREH